VSCSCLPSKYGSVQCRSHREDHFIIRSSATTPNNVSARSQLKTAIELSLAHLVSKCSIGVLRMDKSLLDLKRE
jgi:hypothetical protein